MGYQALLFCPDEKLARIVSQVFGELDFALEPVQEPFAAVKKLMAQRFDAIVVDCENEQNASLIFKSARNSSVNQSTLAIALVEGQAGVAKSYRIGANLVLTKPINVEQAKGTLRVARGLLRKNTEAGGASAPVAGASPAAAKLAAPAAAAPAPVRTVAPPAPAPQPSAAPEFDNPLPEAAPAAMPAMAASAMTGEPPVSIPAPAAQAVQAAPVMEIPKETPKAAAVPVKSSATPFASVGSAAAPAPAKEAPAVKEVKPAPVELVAPAVSERAKDLFASEPASAAPSFAALNADDSGGSGGSKKILIAAVGLVALAAAGYFGYETFGKPSSTTAPSQPRSAPQNSAPPAGGVAPMSAPAPVPSTTTVDRAAATTPGPATKNTAPAAASEPTIALNTAPANSSPAANPPVIKIATAPEAQPRKAAAPMVVKSGSAKKGASQDDAAPPLNTAGDANSSGIIGLVTSATPAMPRVSPTSIRVSQGVSQGLVIKRVQPKYPQAALAAHAGGTVQLEATVDKEGLVRDVKVVSGDQILARAASEAVRQWRYKPYFLDGQPVEIQTQITVNFKPN